MRKVERVESTQVEKCVATFSEISLKIAYMRTLIRTCAFEKIRILSKQCEVCQTTFLAPRFFELSVSTKEAQTLCSDKSHHLRSAILSTKAFIYLLSWRKNRPESWIKPSTILVAQNTHLHVERSETLYPKLSTTPATMAERSRYLPSTGYGADYRP